MKFGNIQAIHFFWLFAALLIFYVWAFRKRKSKMANFADKGLLDDLTRSLDRKKQRLKVILILISIFIIVLALMRPQRLSASALFSDVRSTG